MRIECKSLVINNRIHSVDSKNTHFDIYPVQGKASFMRGFTAIKNKFTWADAPYEEGRYIRFEKFSFGDTHVFIATDPNGAVIVIWELTHRKIFNWNELNIDYEGVITIQPFDPKTCNPLEQEIKVPYKTTGGKFEFKDSEFSGSLEVTVVKDQDSSLASFNFELVGDSGKIYIPHITSIEQHQI